MFPIGLFSKMNRISTKTLRHYDKIGLLKPAYINKENNYRYYSSKELIELYKIMTLKQMGLQLNEILEVKKEFSNIDIYLKIKEKELLRNIQEEQEKIKQIKAYLKIKGDDKMYNPIIKSLPKVKVASMRRIFPSYDTFFELIPKMGEEMEKQGAICSEPAYCFNIYHDSEYKETDLDVEVCEAVIDFCQDSDMVKYKEIPEVQRALCVLHKGPYNSLKNTYSFILKWIEENNYEIIDNIRESYIDGIWNKENPEEWLTEIQVRIK